ncbi:MAG: flagellar filament capping protein FliD [Limnohabitans sp.]
MSTSTSSATSNNSQGQSILTALSAGSGVDVKALAKNLVDAEKAPLANAIQSKISKSEAKISGYGAIKFLLSDLKSKFSALDDLGDFNTLSTSISQSGAFSVETSGAARSGNHIVNVTQLALGQRSISSTGFTKPDSTVSGAMTLNMTLAGRSLSGLTISAGTTASQLVDRINNQWGDAGITAQLVNKGQAATDPTQPYHLVITGPTGALNTFSLTGLTTDTPPIQEAQNASLTVDGMAIESPSNTIEEVITGVKLKLTGETNGPSSLTMTRDVTSVKTKIKDLVSSYNDVMSLLTATADPKSKLETYGATLVGDSTVGQIRNQVRNLFFGSSSTPGNTIKALRDLGISVSQTGTMTLDENRLSDALQSNFDDAVKMLSNSRATPTLLRSVASGAAGDAVKKIDDMLASSALLSTQSSNAAQQQTRYEADLKKLDERMAQLLERYNQQFTAMESLISQINSQKSGLKSTFDAMLNQSK